ncbi:hypothetical protein Tco_0918609 [Tanacetum coccineum]
MERYKLEVLDVEGAPECMKISEFMHRITHPELIRRLYEKILRSMDEMYRVTTSFLQREVAAFSHSRKKAPTPWRQPEGRNKPNFKKVFQKQAKHGRMHVAEEADRGDDQVRVAKQRVTQSFSLETVISFPSLGEEDRTEGPMIIEAEIGGHFVHRIYVAGGETPDDPYYHCFHRIQWRNHLAARLDIPTSKDRTGIRKICDVPSTAHGMLKFRVKGGTMTIRSSRVIPMECAMISGPNTQQPVTSQVLEEKIKVAIHPEYPEQTIAIGSTLTGK